MTSRPDPWWLSALCAQTDPEIFFPQGKGSSPAAARKVCARCPVTAQCLEDALRTGAGGVRGGLTEHERRSMQPRAPKPARRPNPGPPECGTTRGYRAHLRRGEPTCEPCREANRATVTARRERLRRDAA